MKMTVILSRSRPTITGLERYIFRHPVCLAAASHIVWECLPARLYSAGFYSCRPWHICRHTNNRMCSVNRLYACSFARVTSSVCHPRAFCIEETHMAEPEKEEEAPIHGWIEKGCECEFYADKCMKSSVRCNRTGLDKYHCGYCKSFRMIIANREK